MKSALSIGVLCVVGSSIAEQPAKAYHLGLGSTTSTTTHHHHHSAGRPLNATSVATADILTGGRGGSTRPSPPRWQRRRQRVTLVRRLPQTPITKPVLPPLPNKASKEQQVMERITQQQETEISGDTASEKSSFMGISRLDLAVMIVIFACATGMMTPVALLPMIGDNMMAGGNVRAYIAQTAAVSICGGGFGKLLNGLLVQKIGRGKPIAQGYLLGAALCVFGLSTVPVHHPSLVGWWMAGSEFFCSALWVACSLLLAQEYKSDAKRFAKGMTLLSLATTSGQLTTKLAASGLASAVGSWRLVAQIFAGLIACGSLAATVLIPSAPKSAGPLEAKSSVEQSSSPTTDHGAQKLGSDLMKVLSSRLFWCVALAHIPGYLARTADKLLGPFLQSLAPTLPSAAASALTASVTLGFVGGLAVAKNKGQGLSRHGLQQAYQRAACSLLGLAGLGAVAATTTSAAAWLLPAAIACVVSFAGHLAVPFFQLPAWVAAQQFTHQHAIALAFLDGGALWMSAPIWKWVSQWNWSTAWCWLALGVIGGGQLMVRTVGPLLAGEKNQAEAGAS